MIVHSILAAVLLALTSAIPVPEPYPYPYPNPYAFPNPDPAPNPYPDPQGCCMPSPACSNPCPQPFQKGPRQPVVYAPLPGEIVFKLLQNWDTELLDSSSSMFQILEGNIRSAVQAVVGPTAQVTNVYFREGYVPGNPPSRPKTVAHMMVNGGSDAASILEHSVTPDGSLGDGLKVYKDSFNAY
ncbi:uncharacterized protein LOC130644413 [Hydractinia symbiolongicarpus]|uniref:uncharacterized protein LOC130644413 n=1 Tax=Hydractinia symbiolongicarpus TaxID=13093 RepID=UPI00254E37B3|nr:uncharacterized protein LOC130644413 [Hydractinia symbiolongicarpus]